MFGYQLMAIHSTVPKNEKETKADPRIIARRLRLVAHNMTGRANAKTSDELARLCGIEAKGTNERVRSAVKILFVEEKVPLISCNKGFFVAETEDEMLAFIENERSRANALFRNIATGNEILEVWRRPGDPQRRLFA